VYPGDNFYQRYMNPLPMTLPPSTYPYTPTPQPYGCGGCCRCCCRCRHWMPMRYVRPSQDTMLENMAARVMQQFIAQTNAEASSDDE
jgi:hypothetical protein